MDIPQPPAFFPAPLVIRILGLFLLPSHSRPCSNIPAKSCRFSTEEKLTLMPADYFYRLKPKNLNTVYSYKHNSIKVYVEGPSITIVHCVTYPTMAIVYLFTELPVVLNVILLPFTESHGTNVS